MAYGTVKPDDNRFHTGNTKDGKHYWLTPPALMERVCEILGVTADLVYDPAPYPQPEGYDGLQAEWGSFTYLNPPFGSFIGADGKKKGMTAWVRKAIAEQEKGKTVLLVFPQDRWVHMLVSAGAEMIPLGDINWLATEDGTPGPGNSRPTMGFLLRGAL